MKLPLSNSSCNSSNNGEQDYYCTEHPTGALVWGAFSIAFFLLGLPSSLAMMCELLRGYKRGSRNLTNDVFIFNLTIMDILFNISIPFSTLSYLIWHNSAIDKFGDFMFCFTVSGRPLFMAFMSMDWYLAVVYPITYMASKSLKIRVLLSASVWVCTIAYGILIITYYAFLSSTASIITYCILLLILVLCSFCILKVLKSKSGAGSGDIHHVKQKAIQTITKNVVVTLLTYLPPVAAHAFKSLMPISEREFACNIAMIVLIGPIASACVTPLLYLESMGKLKCCGDKK